MNTSMCKAKHCHWQIQWTIADWYFWNQLVKTPLVHVHRRPQSQHANMLTACFRVLVNTRDPVTIASLGCYSNSSTQQLHGYFNISGRQALHCRSDCYKWRTDWIPCIQGPTHGYLATLCPNLWATIHHLPDAQVQLSEAICDHTWSDTQFLDVILRCLATVASYLYTHTHTYTPIHTPIHP